MSGFGLGDADDDGGGMDAVENLRHLGRRLRTTINPERQRRRSVVPALQERGSLISCVYLESKFDFKIFLWQVESPAGTQTRVGSAEHRTDGLQQLRDEDIIDLDEEIKSHVEQVA